MDSFRSKVLTETFIKNIDSFTNRTLATTVVREMVGHGLQFNDRLAVNLAVTRLIGKRRTSVVTAVIQRELRRLFPWNRVDRVYG